MQTTSRPRTIDNTLVATEMSSTQQSLASSKRLVSSSNRRSLSESSAEDLCREAAQNVNGAKNMWRNEISVSPESDCRQPDSSAQSSSYRSQIISNVVDVLLRITIVVVFVKLEISTAYKREIHAEELWLYQNPRRPDYISPTLLVSSVLFVPFLLSIIFYLFTKDMRDFRAASWAWTLAVCFNAVPTSLLKITVGRPRPDFFYRCFPDGIMVLNETASLISTSLDFNCTGRASDINEGRKSFPSGHASFAFASFGFVTYYVGAKLHAFNKRGRGHTWRQAIALTPMFIALLVAVSRTCDYHHHWQDVVVGTLIGLATGYTAYRQYYPSIFADDCDQPLPRCPTTPRRQLETDLSGDSGDSADVRPLLDEKEETKWY